MKKYLIILLWIFVMFSAKAQFGLEATISDTAICLGECVDLWSTYDTTLSLMANDFNDGSLGEGWSSNANPTISSNICGSGPDGTDYAWIGSASSFPRDLVTVDFSLINGCRICFDFRMAEQGDDSPCEGPDEVDEGVHLQYSTDGGNNWTTITYFCPDGCLYPTESDAVAHYGDPDESVDEDCSSDFVSWHNYCFDVPSGAVTSHTRFRWHQEQVTDNDYDHWGVDNVFIYCPQDTPNVVWNDGTQDFWFDPDPPQQCPTQSTDYTVTVYTDDESQDTVLHVSVYNPPLAEAGPDDEICGDTYPSLQANTPTEGVGTWSGDESGISFSDVNDPHSSVTVSSYGPHTLYWTVLNGVCSATDSVVITFDEPPAPNAGIDDEVCGSEYTLNATPSIGQGTWSVSPSYNVHIFDLHNPSSNVEVYAYGYYTFTWHEVNGLCEDSAEVIIKFKQIPTSVFSSDSILCYQDNVNISYQGNASSNATYHWDFDGATINSGSGQGPYSIYWADAGNYSVSLWVEEDGCVSDTSQREYFNPPELTGSLTVDNVMCNSGSDGSVVLNAQGGVPPYTYQWSNGSTDTSLYNVGAGSYALTLTDSHGCQIQLSALVTEPDPLIVTLNNMNVCNGQPVNVVPSVTGGTPPYYYHWNDGSTQPYVSFTPPHDTSVYVVVTDSHGCSDSAYCYIDVTDPLSMQLFVSKDSVCRGDKIVVNGAFYGGAGGPYYIYDGDGNVLTFPFMLTITHDTTFVIYANDVCGSTASDTATVIVYPMPFVMFNADTLAGCQPFTVNFNVTSGEDEVATHVWNFGDNDYENLSLGPNPSHTYNEVGVYTVTLMYTTNKGCKDSVAIDDMITVYPKPSAKFTNKPEVGTVIDPVIDFINLSSGNVLNIWSFGDGDSSIQVSPRHRYPQVASNYQAVLIVESDKGCKDTAKVVVEIQDIPVFYAPTAFTPDNDGLNELFYVVIRNIDLSKDFNLSVYDRWGELIWTTDKYDPLNPSKYGWDGTAKSGSEKSPPDVYVWHCHYYDKDGNFYEKSGNITLIR